MNRNFIEAKSISEAVDLLAEYKNDCVLLAGGTDLLVELHKMKLDVRHFIDISRIQDLRGIEERDQTIKIGPATTHAECTRNAILQKYAPILSEACSQVGSPQIRNRGTIGGNIISAAACADSVPALIVLNGTCTLQSFTGQKVIPISDLITGPNQTVRTPDEICTSIEIEKMPEGARFKFFKLIRRNDVAKSRLTVAAVAKQDSSKNITDIRISVGSTTPRPRRFVQAEEILLNMIPTEEIIRTAGMKVAEEMISVTGYRWSTEYKKPVVESLTARVLNEILEV